MRRLFIQQKTAPSFLSIFVAVNSRSIFHPRRRVHRPQMRRLLQCDYDANVDDDEDGEGHQEPEQMDVTVFFSLINVSHVSP